MHDQDTATWNSSSSDQALDHLSSPSESTGFCKARGSNFSQYAARFLLVVTAPLSFYDPARDLYRSQSSSVYSTVRRRRGRPITMTQARQLALRVLVKAKEDLARERADESRLLELSWHDEDFS